MHERSSSATPLFTYASVVRASPELAVSGSGLLQPGALIPSTDIGATSHVGSVIYGLADTGELSEFSCPAQSTDGGLTWRIDGPLFWRAAAEGPAVTTAIMAITSTSVYAWGPGGNIVHATTDAGQHWGGKPTST